MMIALPFVALVAACGQQSGGSSGNTSGDIKIVGSSTVYPFSKTIEWYLMSKEARQGMMNEHIRIGHEYAEIRQVLLYSTGLDDQEFVVAYEMDDLPRFSALVTALRDTEARRYTLRDTPIVTGVHRPLREALSLIG